MRRACYFASTSATEFSDYYILSFRVSNATSSVIGCVCMQIWGLVAAAAMIFMPAFESRVAVATACSNLVHGKRTVGHAPGDGEHEPSEVDITKHGEGSGKGPGKGSDEDVSKPAAPATSTAVLAADV